MAHRAAETSLDKHGYRTGLTTGNGAGLTFPASWTGQLVNSGGGSELAAIYFFRKRRFNENIAGISAGSAGGGA